MLRVAVLSRNLTTSRAWDSFLCLEGAPERGSKDESADLAALLRALPGLALTDLEPQRRVFLESLADEVHRTSFAAPWPFEGLAHFQTMGFGSQAGFAPRETGEEVLALSPFVSNESLSALRELAPRGRLISRPEEMAKCEQRVVCAWESYCVDDGATSEADAAEVGDELHTADSAPQGLHAKSFAIQNKRRTIWWFGSGNLTKPVRDGTSVEVMVRLEGKTSKVGIDSFLDAGFGTLLVPYEHAPPPPDPQEGSRSAVEGVKKTLARSNLRLECHKSGDLWALTLREAPLLDDRVECVGRPITLPRTRAKQLGGTSVTFEGMTVEALTALVCLQLSAGKGDARFEAELTLKLPVEGLPEDRDAQISRSIIKDRACFLRYLQCLLGSIGEQLPGELLASPGAALGAGSGRTVFASGLLEQLLRALHEEPQRLRGLESLLERTATAAEGKEDVVPEEFRALWTVIAPHLAPEDHT